MSRKASRYHESEAAFLSLVPQDKAMKLAAAKAVVEAYLAPGPIPTIGELVQRSQLSEAMVRQVLSSPEWDAMVSREIAGAVAPLLAKGAKMLGAIIDDETEKASVRIKAHEAALRTYDVLIERSQEHGQINSRDKIAEILAALPRANAIVTTEVPEKPK